MEELRLCGLEIKRREMLAKEDLKYQEILDKQFEIIGEKMKFSLIPETGILQVGKKKEYWYNIYKFTEEQEIQWKEWTMKQLKLKVSNPEEVLMYLELRYGFIRKYKKEGELF